MLTYLFSIYVNHVCDFE